ncbi:MAG: hypothetical protein LW808_001930 [Verrucomicrobiota bacterium]|nr:MAG: hypothetical protein LW808_001930 [Verrucomicrobiota bacterium]
MQAFGLPEGDDPFNTRTTPATKHLTQMKLLFERTDKEQGKYSAELAKAQERLDANKAAPQPQDSAAFSSANVVQ